MLRSSPSISCLRAQTSLSALARWDALYHICRGLLFSVGGSAYESHICKRTVLTCFQLVNTLLRIALLDLLNTLVLIRASFYILTVKIIILCLLGFICLGLTLNLMPGAVPSQAHSTVFWSDSSSLLSFITGHWTAPSWHGSSLSCSFSFGWTTGGSGSETDNPVFFRLFQVFLGWKGVVLPVGSFPFLFLLF